MPDTLIDLPARPDIRRILLIKWSAMGDVVLATTVFEDVRLAFPECAIDLNTMPPWDGLFRHDPRFARVFTVDVRRAERGLRGARRWLREVVSGGYDLIIDLQSTDHTRLLVFLLWLTRGRVPYRMGNHLRFPYNIAPPPQPPAVHALEQLRATLRAGGIPTVTPRPVLHLSADQSERAAALLATHGLSGRRYAVFLPGSQAAGYLKRWGAQRYIELAMRLHEVGVDKVVVIGGAEELDECQRIEQACGPWLVNLAGQTEIPEIVPIAAGACCIIANDTGTAHVAATAATPMVLVCGPTDPRRVRPAGDNVTTLQAHIHCINCYRKTCTHHSCMQLISPAQVMDTLRTVGCLRSSDP